VGLFRRRHETYNEQLMREAGLAETQPAPAAPATLEPHKSLLEHLGIPLGKGVGPEEWQAFATVSVPGLQADRITFVTLPDGDVLVEDAEGDADVSPLADAVEEELRPPYRASATRQRGDLWAVAAKPIEVERIAYEDGDRLELTRKDANLELRVDGELADRAIPELERLAHRIGSEFYVDAVRLDADLWEVQATAL
jgi:hypothetical protein